MSRIYQFYKPRCIDMGVDLRRGDIGMAEQGLEHSQIRSALQKVRRKGVAQYMRADRFWGDFGPYRQFLQQLEQAYSRKMLAARRKQVSRPLFTYSDPYI